MDPKNTKRPNPLQDPTLTAFFHSADQSEVKIRKLLSGIPTQQMSTILFALARLGEVTQMAFLISHYQIEMNLVDEEGRTALTYAAIGNHPRAIRLLVNKGSVVAIPDHSGRTALHWACFMGRADAVEELLKHDKNVLNQDFDGKTCFHLATYPKRIKPLLIICKRIAKSKVFLGDCVDDENMTPLMWAAYYGQPQHTQLLLERGANALLRDIEGKTALHWAMGNKHTQCALLIAKWCPSCVTVADNKGRTPLHFACAEGNIAVAILLLNLQVDLIHINDKTGRSPLHWAAIMGRAALLKILCDHNTELNARDDYGATSLHYAVQRDFIDCIHVLLRYGSDVSVNDEAGRNAITWAAMGGHLDAIKRLLLCQNADINCTDKNGLTPLHASSYANNLNCVVYLLRNGAHLDTQDVKLHTPLFRAVIQGCLEVVVVLLNEGADVNAQDIDGR